MHVMAVGRCAGCLRVCPRFVVSRFTILPPGAGGGLRSLNVALPGDLSILSCGLEPYFYGY